MKRLLSPRLWSPFLLLIVGGAVTAWLMQTPPMAEKKAAPFKGALVSTLTAELTSTRILLQTSGQVRAAQRVLLTSRVAGNISALGPHFEEGRYFKKAEVLVKIDPLTGNARDQILLKAPFDGVVQTRSSDLGQYITPGTQLAVLVGTDQAEVLVDIPLSRMDDLVLNGTAPPAEVRLQLGARQERWTAQVKHLLPELTPQGRMARMVLTVDDPFRRSAPGGTPLFVGAFVQVTLPGRLLEDVIRVPAQALRDFGTVWIATTSSELELRNVEIAHQERDAVYLSSGVDAGERIITSPLKGAANGLKLRVEGAEETLPETTNLPDTPLVEERS